MTPPPIMSAEAPPPLLREQAAAIEKLSRLRAGALFMAMGTGKTRVALELAKSRQADYDRLVWIAPASLLRTANYRDEMARWSGGLERPLSTFTVESISQSDRRYLELVNMVEQERCFAVVDESLTIKNAEAGRTTRLLGLRDRFPFRLILNGTPLTQGLIDLYAQMQFISPKILNMTEAQFAATYLEFDIVRGQRRPWKRWSRPHNEAALIETLRPYIFDAALDLPVGLITHDVDLRLTEEEREQYTAVKRAFLQGRDLQDPTAAVSFLAAAQTFQAAYTDCAAKRAWAASLLQQLSADGEAVLVFVKFLAEIDTLLALAPEAVVYTGGRKDDIRRFTSGAAPVMLATYGTGSMGLNLQHCRNVVFFSQTFDYAHKEHGMHRVYRTGQHRGVRVWNAWVDTGLETLIRTSLGKKQRTLAHVSRLITPAEAMQL